jgi:glycosyltransferase involved in cell wall biosynthesis
MVCYYYPPCASSGVFRTLRFVKHLPEFQWRPVVLTIDPRYYSPQEPIDLKSLHANKEFQEIHAYRTNVLPGADQIVAFLKGHRRDAQIAGDSMPHPQQNESVTGVATSMPASSWQRIKDAITLTMMIPDKHNGWLLPGIMKGLQMIRKEAPSIIYASGGPWTGFLIAAVLKKLTRLPLVIDFRDPWVDNPYNEYQSPFREKVNQFLEKSCVQAADCVIANTEPLRTLFVEKYQQIPVGKFMTLTNGYDEAEFTGITWKPVVKTQEAPLVITHIGTLYSKRSPEKFLLAVAALIRKGIILPNTLTIKLIGKMNISGLKENLANMGLASVVECIDYLPKPEALNASLNSDALLLIQPATRLQIPAKLFEYIRLGRPIFAVCGEGATEEIITANNFGAVAHYDNVDDIERKFQRLYTSLQNPSATQGGADISRMNEKIKQFDARVLTSRLANVFDQFPRA